MAPSRPSVLTWPPATAGALPPPYQRFHLTGDPPATGGFGTVYRVLFASEGGDQEVLALKFVRPPVAEGDPHYPGWIESFQAEAHAGMTLDGANQARTFHLLDLRSYPGWPPLALAMPFYPYNLAQVIAMLREDARRLPPAVVVRWARQLTWAVQDLHAKGFAHRDIKPANIFLRLPPTGEDFYDQIHRAEMRLGDFTTICRTGAERVNPVERDDWKAPELAAGDAATQRSPTQDVYSLGRVLQELAEVTDGNTTWLTSAADGCLAPPDARPALEHLEVQLSPDFAEHVRLLTQSGHRPEEHPHFVPRDFVQTEFGVFAARCDQRGHGGVFAIEAVAGVGKTALMTHWANSRPDRTAYYFRFRDGRTVAEAMPESLCRQLRSQHNLPDNYIGDNPADHLRTLLRQLTERDKRATQHLIFIDGLDECSNPAEAVTYLPVSNLPARVFLIVSSRPPTDSDYLATMVQAGAHRFRIDPMSARNLADVERYFRERVGAQLTAGQTRQLAEATGGMFQLATLFVAEMTRTEQPASASEILIRSAAWVGFDPDRRMYAYYDETWRRIRDRLRPTYPDIDHHLNAFAQVLAVAQDWLDLEQTLELLYWLEDHGTQRSPARWNPTVFAAIQAELRWLVEERDRCWYAEDGVGYLQLRHQSMRDFFISSAGMRGVRLGLARMHADIGRHYLEQARERRFWMRVDPYGRLYAVRHLLLANRDAEVIEALRMLHNIDYLQATLGLLPPEERS